jgi:hypothetical protein
MRKNNESKALSVKVVEPLIASTRMANVHVKQRQQTTRSISEDFFFAAVCVEE